MMWPFKTPLRVSILVKIASGFGLMVVLIAASTGITLHSSLDTMGSVNRLTASANPIVLANGALDLELSQLGELFQLHQGSDDPEQMARAKEQIKRSEANIVEQSQALLGYLDNLGNTAPQVATVDQFSSQVATLLDHMAVMMSDHENGLGLNGEVRERRAAILAQENSISTLFEDLLWSLPDDESIITALEFYASFLNGLMIIKNIDIADDAETLSQQTDAFNNWIQQHGNQFFNFTNLVAAHPETRELVQTVNGITDDLIANTQGTPDSEGLIALRGQINANALRYRTGLAELNEEIEQAKEALTQLNDFATRYAQQTNLQVTDNLQRTLTLSVASLTVSFALALLVSALIIRSIRRPMAQLTNALQHLAKGDLTHEITHHTRDEMGELTQSVDHVRKALLDMIDSIRSQSSSLQQEAKTSQQLAQDTRDRASDQREQTDSIATSMQEMTTTVTAVGQATQEGMQHADSAVVEIDETVLAVTSNLQTLADLKDRIGDAERFTEQLSHRMADIETVSKVIRDIAEQTNLLALNAAIEAARAGEHGRGFAVVADEVRALASRTQSSTNEIRQTIEGLLQGHEELSHTMQSSRDSVTESHRVSAETTNAIQAFRERVDQLNSISQQIHATTTEQGTTAEDINQRLTTVADIARANEDMAEQTMSASVNLGLLTDDLELLVKRFKV
ncbi:MAG: methyl-accepting chemotaxis protein [Natronospirillum sp.]